MNRLFIFLTIVLAGAFVGCDSFVEDVDLPIDSIEDAQLNDESQVSFLIKGVQTRFSTTYDRLAVFSDGMSDALVFTSDVGTATFPSFQEMEDGDISFANNSNDGVYDDLGELRFFSDNLITRLQDIEIEDAALRTEAEFTAYLYGGIARYFYATYYGLSQREGGGVITTDPDNPGPFIPSSDMYTDAISELNSAAALGSAEQVRFINTLIARIHLFQGNYGEARTAAAAGMVAGDAAFESLHAIDSPNEFWSQAGNGRIQWVVDFRFQDYIDLDPDEANRLPFASVAGNSGTEYLVQDKYSVNADPLPFATWQENELMLAELDIRDGDAAGALTRINAVRAGSGLAALEGPADMTLLIDERDKELFTMGLRLPDQRRMDLWHLGPDTWQYLPITQGERNINDNF